jgi:hypothetical protein
MQFDRLKRREFIALLGGAAGGPLRRVRSKQGEFTESGFSESAPTARW